MSKKTDIIWLKEVNSTNEYIKRHINELDNLSVVSTLSQTSGKGQGSHTWHSEPASNLLFSILIKEPGVKAADQKIISETTAHTLVELLGRHGINAWVKPPNDIWVGDKKICGILIEHSLRAGCILWTIIGIGLNVNQTSFPADLPNPTSMAILKEGGNLDDILSEFMEIFTHTSLLR